MKDDVFRRFLGVEETADPRALLGLSPGERDRVRIETALRDRLGIVYRHPDGRSREAERVRLRLRQAAARLLDPSAPGMAPAPGTGMAPGPAPGTAGARPGTPSPARVATAAPESRPGESGPRAHFALTEFDRKVLAVLVACGGWNTRSRARLVALAGAYRLAPHGLVTVVRGLSDYARAGGPRLGAAEIGPVTTEETGAPTVASSPVGGVLDRLTARDWVPELKEDSLGATVRLSLFFGLIAVLAFVLFVRGLIGDAPPEPSPPETPAAVADPIAPTRRPTARAADASAGGARPARFDPAPGFLGNALPPRATSAADAAPGAVEAIDLVTRKLSITDEPSEAVYRSWAAAIDDIATGWVLVDDSTLRGVDRAIDDALHEATNAPSKGDRLLQTLVPPRGRLADPVDVWRGAWCTGTLMRIAGQSGLPSAVVEQARRMLAVAVPDSAQDETGFDAGASAWLNQAIVPLVEATEIEQGVDDFWEMWLAAERTIGGADRRQRTLLAAVTRMLETSTDLSRAGPSLNVLARLLTEANFVGSAVVRDATIALFDRRETVSDHDLWVLTSLLCQLDTAPWFGSDLVLPDQAGLAFRNRIRDRIDARWPEIADTAESAAALARGLQIDPRAVAKWRDAVAGLESLPAPDGDVGALERLALAARLNETALRMSLRQRAEAETLLGGVEAIVAEVGRRPLARAPDSPLLAGAGFSRPARGQATGVDGEWAEAYADARRKTTEKLKWLRALGNQAGSDLGPLDAEVFVREVYHGTPKEVRSVARSILVEQFVDGPEVAMEMLDQFPDAPRADRTLAEVLRHLTGRLLPSSRSEASGPDARLALARHALALRRDTPNLIDDLAVLLRECYVDRTGLVDRGATEGLTARTPQSAAAHLADAWRDRARGAIARRAVPDDLAGLARRRATRRRLARGPVQLFVAEQITMLEYHAYVAVAEQPAMAEAVLAVLVDSSVRRRDASHLLAQATEAELAMARIWALRMGLAPSSETAAVIPAAEGGGAWGGTAGDGRVAWVTLAGAIAASVLAAPDTGLETAFDADELTRRLERLRPEDPLAYFLLAEELADVADDEGARRLVHRLFALAGALDASHLGRSACLALADIETDETARRRLLALASLLGGGRLGGGGDEAQDPGSTASTGAVIALTESFSYYRRGEGPRCLAALREPGASELLAAHEWILPGGMRRYVEDARLHRGRLRPNVSETTLERMLELEVGLLAGADRPWSSDLLLSRGRPLIEVDPDRLAETLGVNADRALFRNGRWVSGE